MSSIIPLPATNAEADTTWDLAPDGSVADEFWSDSEGGAGAGDDPFSLAQEEGAFSASYATGIERYEAKNSEVKMALYTGGKGKVSNLFQLTATANEEYPINTNLLPEQITVGGQGLNASAIAYTTFPDGAPVDVTPQAGAQYYNFTVGATKYLSYLEVFVCQPYPGRINPNAPGLPPVGFPLYRSGVHAGHAWWELTTEAPGDAVNQFMSANLSQWLGQQVGYGPTNGYSGFIPCPAEFPWPNSDPQTTNVVYEIGFDDLISGLTATEGIYLSPGTYSIWSPCDCVSKTCDIGKAVGIPLPYDRFPENFGADLPPAN